MFKGNKTLNYKVKKNGKNINGVPVYMNQLDLMKTEKGENGIVIYCTKCHSFLYLDNIQQKYLRNHTCCDIEQLADFCEYCCELFNEESICCLRKCFDIFKDISYSLFLDECCFVISVLPIISLMWVFLIIFKIIFYKRRKKTDDINYIDTGIFEPEKNITFYIFLAFLSIVYSLIFFVPYFFTIYFFHVFLMIKVKRQIKEDKANNIIRY